MSGKIQDRMSISFNKSLVMNELPSGDALKVRLALLFGVDQTAFDIAALVAHIQRILPMGIERHFMTAAGTFHHTFSSP